MCVCACLCVFVALQWLTSNVQDEHAPHKDFPPPDLLEKLIDLYFKNMNDYLPLLHRPTFEQGVREGLHLRDDGTSARHLVRAGEEDLFWLGANEAFRAASQQGARLLRFQQAYQASSRVIQVARETFQSILSIQ